MIPYNEETGGNAIACEECGVATIWRLQLTDEPIRKWRCPNCVKARVPARTWAAIKARRSREGDAALASR